MYWIDKMIKLYQKKEGFIPPPSRIPRGLVPTPKIRCWGLTAGMNPHTKNFGVGVKGGFKSFWQGIEPRPHHLYIGVGAREKVGGFIALISIVIIGALILAIAVGVSLRSVGETNMVLGEEMSNQALSLADACADYAILRLKNNLNYEGNENIIVEGNHSCDILPTEGTGNLNRVVKTQSLVRGHKRKIKIDITQVKPLKINSWLEVSDF